MHRVPEYTAVGKNKHSMRCQESQWEVAGTYICMVNNENLLCIVDYYSKFLVVKKMEMMSAKELIPATKVVFRV